ncbi:hypothetical protein D9M69_545990 [compost metagenome]
MGSIQPNRPQASVSAAASTKAPMASLNGTPASAVTSRAAPGVDHAMTMGRPVRRLYRAPPKPNARLSEPIHEPIRAASRPAVWPACTISTAVPPKLTRTATRPAVTADAERSRRARWRGGGRSMLDCAASLMRHQ